MIIESVNIRPRGLLKVRISMQNQLPENPSNQFFGSKGCRATPSASLYGRDPLTMGYFDKWIFK
jgi:hypothetical protein